jgi:hypothetical protein
MTLLIQVKNYMAQMNNNNNKDTEMNKSESMRLIIYNS